MNESRIERVLQNMQKAGLEQIVVTSTSSVYYLTGLWVEPLERMLALYLNTHGAYCSAITCSDSRNSRASA